MIMHLIDMLGNSTLNVCNMLGRFALFLVHAIRIGATTRPKIRKIFAHMERIGVESIYIIILTGFSSGMVFALQTYVGFERVGGEQFLGVVVALAMARELGPVLTGIMVTGRAGSAMTAEIGTMRITEQIDALRTLRINTFQYLIVPRILAGAIILPFLNLFCVICGVVGGYLVAVHVLGLSSEDYVSSIKNFVELSDITGGMIKASIFGLILSWVGTYKGYYTYGGARGVGIATTQSVVASSVLILASDYFLTKILEAL